MNRVRRRADPDALVSATAQTRPTCRWRRPSLPALSSIAYGAVGVGVVAFVISTGRPTLSSVEENFVGRWCTSHGNVETTLEFRDDHSVTVSQTIRVRLAAEDVRVFGPTTTSGRWCVEGGHLRLETSAAALRVNAWNKLGIFARSHRWPAEGELHREWRIVDLSADRFGFVDTGTGRSGRAFKTDPAFAQSADAPTHVLAAWSNSRN